MPLYPRATAWAAPVFRVPDAAWPAWAVACPSGPG